MEMGADGCGGVGGGSKDREVGREKGNVGGKVTSMGKRKVETGFKSGDPGLKGHHHLQCAEALD